MNYRFFTNSEKTWEAMYESISHAENSIYLEMYIFEDTVERFHFFDLLKEKAEKGIQIKLILDAFGSMELSNNKLAELKKSGAEVLFQSYLFHRAHRKILIVDEFVAYIGGANVHKTARLWNDLVVRVEGVLVRNIMKSFAKSYTEAGGKDPLIVDTKNKISLEKVNAWVVEHSPFRNIFNLRRIYQKHLNSAQKRIILVTPYFTPKRWLRALLHQAVLRGVTVEVLVPAHTDHAIINRINYFYMHHLAQLGIKFYLESQMNHAKVMIIDTDEGLVGSQNLDVLSFEFNSEIGVFFQDKEVVGELLTITDTWKRDAVLFDTKKYKPKWFDIILSSVIGFFSRNF